MNPTEPTKVVTVFGATSPTGYNVCLHALALGYQVRAVSRRTDLLPLPPSPGLVQVKADAQSGEGVAAAVAGADAVLSGLGAAYQRGEVRVYSVGTRNIVDAMRVGASGRRLVVVSSGLTYPPPKMNWFADHLLFPLLRDVIGRTLYADMRRMEEYLRFCDDIDWTVMRPGRLFNAGSASHYRLDPGEPTQGYTSRADLAAAMVAELGGEGHVHQVVSPTTTRR